MKKIHNKVTLLNILSNCILQFVTIISGFVIPKIILNYFGSEVNGLISSLNQFLNYIYLVEGGLTGVITASLYKPIVNKEYDKISSIIKTANKFYKKIGLIFVIYTIILAIAYPLIVDVHFSFSYVFILTLILSTSLLIQYLFSISIRILLNADKKVYIVAFTQSLILILSCVFAYLSVKIYPSIHVLKGITGLLFLLQPIIFNKYQKEFYKLNLNAKEDNDLLRNRWDGFAINIAYFIHNSTDITILTFLKDLSIVSVYSVYALVTSGIRSLINSITVGINPVLGQAYARGNLEEINNKMDMYEYIIFMLVFIIFSVGALLITPFVMLYTNGIKDANYFQPLLGYLMLIAEALYLLKFPHLNLAYVANKFKEITKPAFIEAFINIVLSLILVFIYGINGILIATIIAMIYRMIYHVNYTKTIIPNRSPIIFYKKFFVFCFFDLIAICISILLIPVVKGGILNWLFSAFIYTIVFLVVYSVASLLLYKNEINYLINYLRKKDYK